MATTRPLPTVGVDKYTFFAVASDDDTGTIYDDGAELLGTVEIAPFDESSSEIFASDNGVYDTITITGRLGHTLTNADIPPAVDAAWRGHNTVNGVCEVSDSGAAAYFGVAWRVMKSDGSYRYVRFYKGAYSFGSHTGGRTRAQSSYSPQTAKAEYTAVRRISDGAYYAYIDEGDLPDGVTAEELEENWFSDLNWYPA